MTIMSLIIRWCDRCQAFMHQDPERDYCCGGHSIEQSLSLQEASKMAMDIMLQAERRRIDAADLEASRGEGSYAGARLDRQAFIGASASCDCDDIPALGGDIGDCDGT